MLLLGPPVCSGHRGFRCLPLSDIQFLNSLCAHVPGHAQHSQAVEVRSQATTCTHPKASLCQPLRPSGRAAHGAETPAQNRTHSGVSVCQLFVPATRHGSVRSVLSAAALPLDDQNIAFSSMPPDRYPRSRYRPDGTRRRTQNEWLARKGKGKGGGNAKGKGNGGGRGGPGNGKGEPRDRVDDRPRNSQEHRDDRDHRDRDDRRDREEQDEGHRRRRDAHREWEEPEEERGSTRRVSRNERRQDREDDRQRDRSRDRDRGTWTDWGQGWTWQNNRSWNNEDREDRRPNRRYDENERPQGEWRQRTDNRDEARTGRPDRRAEHRPAREERGRGDRSRPPAQQRRQERPADREEPRSDDRAAARRDPRPPTLPDSPRKRRQAARGPAVAQAMPAAMERWSKISDLLRHLRAGGAVEHLESFIYRGHTKKQHDRFHKPGSRTKSLPGFGNWNLSFFAFLLAGEVIGPQETSQEATYGAAIEGWISVLHDEEEDDLIRELLDSVIQGLTVVMELFEDTPSQLHDAVHWKTNEPDFDRVMRHFYPREIPRGMEPKSAPKGDRSEEDAPKWEDSQEQPQGSRGPDPEVAWTEDETWEEDWESTDREDQGAEETAPETPGLRQLVGRLPSLPGLSKTFVLPLIILITRQENWSTSMTPRSPNDFQSC